MKLIIVSIESITNMLSIHLIEIDLMSKVKTIKVPIIANANILQKLKEMLINEEMQKLANWFKREYNLEHCKITISLGPELYDYIKKYNRLKQREKTINGIKTY